MKTRGTTTPINRLVHRKWYFLSQAVVLWTCSFTSCVFTYVFIHENLNSKFKRIFFKFMTRRKLKLKKYISVEMLQLFFMTSVFWLCHLESTTCSTVTDWCSFMLASACSFMASHVLLNVVLSSMQNYECCVYFPIPILNAAWSKEMTSEEVTREELVE